MPMQSTKLFLFSMLLFLIGSFSSSSHAQLQCESLFQYRKAEAVLLKKNSSFVEFEELKAKYRAHMLNNDWSDQNKIVTDVQKIAFLEAYGDIAQNDFFTWLKTHSEDNKRSKQFLRMVAGMNLSRPMSKAEMESLLEDLYDLSNPVPTFLQKLIGPSAQEFKRRRLNYEEAKKDFYSMLLNLGLIRTPNMRERFLAMRKSVNMYTILAKNVALASTSLFFTGSPYLVWEPNFTNRIVHLENIDMASRTDMLLARTQRIFTGFLAAVILSHLSLSDFTYQKLTTDATDAWEASIGVYDMAFQKTVEVDPKLLQESMTKPIYQVWAQAFELTHHRMPDPINSWMDRAIWIHFIVNLESAPDN